MMFPGIALFLLLGQNAAASPASIDGIVVSATGGSLAKVTVTLTEIRGSTTASDRSQSSGVAPNSLEYALLLASLDRVSNGTASTPGGVTTTSDGKFLFENVKPGTYMLKATAGGYAPAEYGQRGPNGRGIPITLKPGQKLQGIALTLMPEGSITGRVVDSNGEPLIRALVQAHKVVYQERGRALVTVQAVPTDDKGQYRLFWLPPGKYYISAMPPDERMRTISVMLPSANSPSVPVANFGATSTQDIVRDIGIGPNAVIPSEMKVTSRTLSNGEVIEEVAPQVFYPAALEVSAAAAVEVRTGETTSGIEITTRTVRAYRIFSRLIDATGRSVSAGEMVLLRKSDVTVSEPVRASMKANGSGFEIVGVLPGSYDLFEVGTSTDGSGLAVVGVTSIEVQGSNLENVVVSGSPPFAIQGRISSAGTISNSASNYASYIVRLDPQNPAILASGELTLGNSMPVRQDKFILAISIATDYRITVTSPPNTYVQSVRLGGQDVLRDGLHIDKPTDETLEIVIRPNAGRIEGVVFDDANGKKPSANAVVVLVPAVSLRQQSSLYQKVTSSSDGHFIFENITPGAYTIFSWDDVEDRAWFDDEFLRNFEGRGREVAIREGAKENIEVTVISR